MGLRTKLTLLFMIVSLVPLGIAGLTSRQLSSHALEDQAVNQLTALRDALGHEVQARFGQLMNLMVDVRGDPRFTEGVPAFAAAYAEGGKEGFQYMMEAERRNYSLGVFREVFGFDDVLLADTEGHVIYSVVEGPELGQSLTDGALAATGLGEAYRKGHEDTTFIDFAPYGDKGTPTAFIATPVEDQSMKLAGVALFRLSNTLFDEIVQSRTGMGETGEAYLVGPQGYLRTDSVLDKTRTVAASFGAGEEGRVQTKATAAALRGETGTTTVVGRDGADYLSAYAPLEVGGRTWAILVEISKAEAFAQVTRLERFMMAVGGAVAVLLLLFVPFIARTVGNSVARPVRRVIEGLTRVSDGVAGAAGHVSEASNALAAGAEQQASSLTESAATLHELTEATESDAEHTREANELTADARQQAEQGSETMTRMVGAIGEIKGTADETVKIIRTIDEIAFQTNLLALNAAVEAARAGDAGRGFAVVAEEVRNLALRSAEAAKTTNRLLETSREKADLGVQVAHETEAVLARLMELVNRVDGLVRDVADSGQRQAQGLRQVNDAVAQMDQLTQSNSNDAQQTAATAQELTAESAHLLEMIDELVQVVGRESGTAKRRKGKRRAKPNGVWREEGTPAPAEWSNNGRSDGAEPQAEPGSLPDPEDAPALHEGTRRRLREQIESDPELAGAGEVPPDFRAVRSEDFRDM